MMPISQMDFTIFTDTSNVMCGHRTSGQLEMAKKYPMDFEGTMRTPSSRASKRAPTWWSGEATPKPFTGQPAPEAGHKRVLGMASPDYQVEAHFEALGEGVLKAPSKSIGYFFAISSCPEVRCTADANLHFWKEPSLPVFVSQYFLLVPFSPQ